MEKSNVLREINSADSPNTSLKNQLHISVTETDQKKVNGEETSKENHSPKSLSSLAADKSRLLGTPQPADNTSTSTPKLAKKQEPSEFDPDISIEISPKYKRALLDQPVKETSLSFLTSGLEKLGLASSDGERSNFTLSDDDEAFQECQSSLSDLSGVKNTDDKNDTLEAEIQSPNSSNKTLVLESNVTFDKVVQNATFDAVTVEDVERQEHKTVEQATNDNTFNFPQEDGGFSEISVKDIDENEVISPKIDATMVISESEPASETFQQEFVPSEPVNFDTTVDVDVKEPPVSANLDATVDVDVKEPENPETFDSTFPAVEIFVASNKSEIPDNFAFEHATESPQPCELSQEALETPLPDTPVSEAADCGDVSMEDVSADRQEIVSSFPEASQSPEIKEEFSYRNIDESGKFDKTQTIPESTKVFTEEFKNSFEVQFKMPAPVAKPSEVQSPPTFPDEEFGCGTSYNFADSDFDYLNNIGSEAIRNSLLNRDSVLLKFDPLLSRPVVVNKRLSDTKEEVDDFVADLALKIPVKEELEDSYESNKSQNLPKEHEMSAEIMKDYNTVAENKSQEESFINEKEESTKASLHNNSAEYLEKMAELENKLKKEADVREEQLLKRISEKDKQIAKMNGVVEAYEKAISELIAEKEQLVQSYERKCIDLKSDSELNANHLASLEATFSDLHAKYERAKHVALELNDREKVLVQERHDLKENLKMQESRYDKMKSHAMAQLEIANNTLADLSRNHSAEVTKLKALLKKEEISRASINEQLIQKSKENAELVKICDELINGTQS